MSLAGVMSICGFVAGGNAPAVSISDRSVNVLGFGSQIAAYRLLNTGAVQKGENGVYSTIGTWLNTTTAADYDVRITETGGEGLTSGTTGSWLSLGTNYEWAREEVASGFSSSAEFLVEIRMAVSPFTVLDSANITLNTTSF